MAMHTALHTKVPMNAVGCRIDLRKKYVTIRIFRPNNHHCYFKKLVIRVMRRYKAAKIKKRIKIMNL